MVEVHRLDEGLHRQALGLLLLGHLARDLLGRLVNTSDCTGEQHGSGNARGQRDGQAGQGPQTAPKRQRTDHVAELAVSVATVVRLDDDSLAAGIATPQDNNDAARLDAAGNRGARYTASNTIQAMPLPVSRQWT